MLPSLLAIALLQWAVLLVPGFNVVLLAQLAGGQSRAAAFAVVAGMTTATLAWATLAVLGIGVVFSTQPMLRRGGADRGRAVPALSGVQPVALRHCGRVRTPGKLEPCRGVSGWLHNQRAESENRAVLRQCVCDGLAALAVLAACEQRRRGGVSQHHHLAQQPGVGLLGKRPCSRLTCATLPA